MTTDKAKIRRVGTAYKSSNTVCAVHSQNVHLTASTHEPAESSVRVLTITREKEDKNFAKRRT